MPARIRSTTLLVVVALTAWANSANAQRLRPSISIAPTAPTGIAAAPAQTGGVTVTWQPSMGAAQYQLLRTADPAVPGVAIGTPTTATSATDPSPLPSAAFYLVVAIAPDGRQATSAPVGYTPPPPPASIATGGAAGATRFQRGATAPVYSGAPPVRLAITPYNAGNHRLAWDWDGVHGALYWQVYLQQLPSPTWQLVKDRHSYKTYDHMDFIAPNSATFRVVAVYPDGTQGAAELAYPNPPQPVPPAGLAGTQVSPGSIRFSWQPSPGAAGYRLSGPAIASTGLSVGNTSTQIVSGIPVGTHQFSIASIYQNGKASAPATATISVRPTSATYRVSIKGFLVAKATSDDPLSFDGKGDEVFVAAYWAAYPYHDRNIKGSGFVQSAVYGDANQAPARIQAGSITTLGGLRDTDAVPNLTAGIPQPGIAVYPDRLPLLVWQGVLSENGDAVGINPTIWESDRNMSPNWATWQNWFTTPNGRGGFVDGVQNNVDIGKKLEPVSLFGWSENFPLAPGFNVGQGADRPIGIGRVSGLPNENAHGPVGVVLTRERVEKALGAASAIVIPFHKYDRLELGGSYYFYLQIERLP